MNYDRLIKLEAYQTQQCKENDQFRKEIEILKIFAERVNNLHTK